MKKLLTLALVGAMLTATGITAFAADPTTDVTYEVAPVYTVVIPESVTLGDTAVTETIRIYGADENSNVVIGKKQKVNVALTASANDFKVKTADGDEVAYTVNDKNAVADLTTVAECTAAEGKKNTDITFTKTGTAAYAGTYTDTLTFNIAVEDAVSTPTLADAFENGATIKLKVNDEYGVAEINFVNENGSITFEDASNSWFTNDARGSIRGDNLTIQLSVGWDYGDRFINTFVFNKANNTYSYSCGGYRDTTLSGLVINDADITDQLTAQ